MAEKIPASYITKKIQYLKKNRELIKEGLSASGIVGPDWLGKVLDFIFSLYPATRPYQFNNCIEKTEEFLSDFIVSSDEEIDKDNVIDYLV